MAERRYDAAPGAVTGKDTARTRYALNRYMPHVRGKRFRPDQKSRYGLAIWPDERRPQFDLWIAHTARRRMGETYGAPSSEVKTDADGKLVISIDWGTERSWE